MSDDEQTIYPSDVREWIFTFGCGQPYAGRFVRITGTNDQARASSSGWPR